MKKRIFRIFIIIGILTFWQSQGQMILAASDFPEVVDRLFCQLTDTIYKDYIQEGHKSIILLPVVSRGNLDTTLSRNCNLVLIDRLNRRMESLPGQSVEVKAGGVTDRKKPGSILIQIELSDIKIKGKSFMLKIHLKEMLPNGETIIKETLDYAGEDEKIQSYITPKPSVSLIVWIFIGIMALIFLVAILNFLLRKRFNLLERLVRQENFPFWRMALISMVIILLFFILLSIFTMVAKSGHAYYEGAEVHFFIDRNSGLFFDDGENNFINIMKGILGKTCKRISDQILHPYTPELEKQGDILTRFINWFLEKFGLERYRLRQFADIKQAEYTYSIYTFSADDLELVKAGNLAELVHNYDTIINHTLENITSENRESSLIKPLVTLHNKLVESHRETKPKKKFIIIFSDAAEIFLENVITFLENVNRFYSHKDQYLRVFSILFPNIPRVSTDLQIYPYEEGKLLLLSKISEFIVYMNARADYTPRRLIEINERFYERLEEFTRRDVLTEENYERKLSEFEKLISHMKDRKLLSIHQIARQNFLKNFVEVDTPIKSGSTGRPAYNDFFLYTYVKDLYQIPNLDYNHRREWIIDDYQRMRSEIFGQPLDPGKVKQAVNDITDTFVNQFILIDKQPDKESLVFKISFFITIFSLVFSVFYAWLLYRYKYDVNYWLEKKDQVINITATVLILILLITVLVYFRYENRWTIYGNWVWAFLVSSWFLFSCYYLPFILRWLISRKFQGQDMRDNTLAFDEVVWIKWMDRILFNIVIVPFLTFSIFMQILSPAYKKGIKKVSDTFISILDTLFKDWLNLVEYYKVNEYFLILWVIVAVVYLSRAFIYSNTARTVYK